MADNVTLPLTGSGDATAVAATDDVSGVHYQFVKLVDGTADSTQKIPGTSAYGLRVDLARLPYSTYDTFSAIRTTNQTNLIDVQFYRDVPNNMISVTATANASANQINSSYGQFTVTNTGTARVTGVTNEKIHYTSGSEVYCIFSVAFLDTPDAGVTQRIGVFDTDNGVFLGYEGTAFSVTVRSGASDTSNSSFSHDALSGAAGSKFTRNGTPEAIDLTKLNVFRIRYGWLGAAPIKWEVLSPDGEWVLFHEIKYPNTTATPSIRQTDLPMTIDINRTTGTAQERMNTTCWGGGCTNYIPDFYESGQLAVANNSTVVWPVQQQSTVSLQCRTTTSGTFIIEASQDGVNWFTPQVIKYGSTGFDTIVDTSQTPAAGDVFNCSTATWKLLRVRTVTTLGAITNFVFNAIKENTFVQRVRVSPAPHNIGYTYTNKANTFTTAQTGTALWTPASGKRLVITSYQIQAYGTTAGTVQLWFGASGDTSYTRGTDLAVFDGEFAPSNTQKPGVVQTGVFLASAADHILRLTTNTTISVTVSVWGYEA